MSILLLLQTRGRMTAAQLAEELEVSVRTVYRDVEALHAAGVPLYGDAGHAGGYRLLAGYRTRLTGLTAGEAEALFLAGIPGPAAELGLGSVLAAAQLKLRAALPPELRDAGRPDAHPLPPRRARLVRGRATTSPYLPRSPTRSGTAGCSHVRYRRWKEPTDVDRRLEPYGLVLKAGRWYVVAGPGPRTYRVDQILELAAPDEEFDPPDDFDLAGLLAALPGGLPRPAVPGGEAVVRLAPGAALARAVPLDRPVRRRTAGPAVGPHRVPRPRPRRFLAWARTSRSSSRPNCASGWPGRSPNWPNDTATPPVHGGD